MHGRGCKRYSRYSDHSLRDSLSRMLKKQKQKNKKTPHLVHVASKLHESFFYTFNIFSKNSVNLVINVSKDGLFDGT